MNPPAICRHRRTRRSLYAAIGVGLVAAVLIAVLATRSVPPGTSAATSLGGKLAPTVEGRSIVGGNELSLSGLRGRFTVLDFFASWCQPCLDEAPQIEEFLFSHRSGVKVAVLGVDIDDSAANGAAFLRRTGATWSAIEDVSGTIAQRYGVSNPPQSFVINPSGRVVGRITGGVTVGELDSLILAAEQNPT